MPPFKANQIFIGEVASVQNYGAFVKIPGGRQQGLIHRSQVSSVHVDDVSEILQKGDRVWCKVISIGDDEKISLSMKFVDQGNGKDLDPNNVHLQMDEQKRKKVNYSKEKKKIVLDAVYNVTCTKCKTRGHLAKDCFSTPDGKKYELIPEIDEPAPQIPKPQNESENKTKEKKHKSKKSKKSKKKSKHEDSDSEDSDSLDKKSKKRKKKSKEQKHKKRKRCSSSSDSDSSDSSVSTYENKKHSKKCKRSKDKHSD